MMTNPKGAAVLLWALGFAPTQGVRASRLATPLRRGSVPSLSASASAGVQAGSTIKVITSDVFQLHKPAAGQRHPECPERVTLTAQKLRDEVECIEWGEPSALSDELAREATLAQICEVHDSEYVAEVEALSEAGGGRLDGDTFVAPATFEVGVQAQSAWLDAVDHVLQPDSTPAFALTRPPGHHACKSWGMGFCVFNFAAVAANYALNVKGLRRVAMLDWDVHHGNGVAALVREDPRIRYASLHELGSFPNTGQAADTGDSGNLLHLPLPPQAGWREYELALRDKVLPWLKEFEPDLVFVCAGFDALALDPLASCQLTAADYGRMTTMLRQALGDKVVLGLEGGYSLDLDSGLPAAVSETILAMTAAAPEEP